MAEKMHLSFLIIAMIGCITLMVPVSSKTTHLVGGEMGWSLPSYSNFYADWAKKQTFAVGDELLFKYRVAMNTVVQVSKEDYEHCGSKIIFLTFFRGDSSFILKKPGSYYFMNNVGKHCEHGQKLAITVPSGKPAS